MGSNAGETETGAINGGSQNLDKSPVLLDEGRLEVELELDLIGNSRNHLFPVLSGTRQKKSGNLIPWKYVRAQLMARNLLHRGMTTRNVLNGGPPLGVEENLIAQPVRNRRLFDRRTIKKQRNALGQPGLAARNLYCTAEGSNVIWLGTHRGAEYKAANYSVKQAPNMTAGKAPHMLGRMGAPRKKQPTETRVRRVKELKVWADGLTANARFKEAFEEWRHHVPPGAKRRTEKDLERACNEIVGLAPDSDPAYVSQSMINQLKKGRVDASSSALLDVLAEALGFRSVWIRTGTGDRKPVDAERVLADLLKKVSAPR